MYWLVFGINTVSLVFTAIIVMVGRGRVGVDLGWTDGRILDFSFGGRAEKADEMALWSASRCNPLIFMQIAGSPSGAALAN